MGADGTRFLRSGFIVWFGGCVGWLDWPLKSMGREGVRAVGGCITVSSVWCFLMAAWIALVDVQMLTDGRKSCVRVMCYGERS